MLRKALGFAFACSLAFTCFGCANETTSVVALGEEVEFNYEWNEAETLVYDMTVEQSIDELGTVKLEGTMTTTTDEVTEETVTTTTEMNVEVVDATGDMQASAEIMADQMSTGPVTTVTDLEGKPLETTDNDVMAALSGIDFDSMDYPTRVGESVTQTIEGFEVTTTLERVDEIDGVRVAVITSVLSLTDLSEVGSVPDLEMDPDFEFDMEISMEMEFQIEVDTGRARSMTQNMEMRTEGFVSKTRSTTALRD